MLVGVVSDTHDNLEAARQAARLFREAGVDLIIHLGDIVAPFTLKVLGDESGKKIIGVYGNNCGEKLGLKRTAERLGSELYEPPRTVELAGRRLLLVHGFGGFDDTIEVVDALAESRKWDAVLYGHTHEARLAYKYGVLILNPGEASGVLYGKRTVAVLDLELLRARIYEL